MNLRLLVRFLYPSVSASVGRKPWFVGGAPDLLRTRCGVSSFFRSGVDACPALRFGRGRAVRLVIRVGSRGCVSSPPTPGQSLPVLFGCLGGRVSLLPTLLI